MPGDSHPLVASLAEAGRISSYFQMPLVDIRDGGWTSARDLFLGDDEYLRRLVQDYGQAAWGAANNHVAGSAFIIAYLTRVVHPALAQLILYRRLPNVSLDNLAFHRTNGRIDATGLVHPCFAALPGDPAAGHPDAIPLADGPALLQQLVAWLFNDNAAPVIEALCRAARASVRVSHNAVAAACAQALHQLYTLAANPDLVAATAAALFQDPASPAYRQVSMEVIEQQGGKRGLFGRRAGCCLVWRTQRADGYCANCILTPRGEQTRHFRQMLQNLP
jgi:ferric iron reductase protein FhuF